MAEPSVDARIRVLSAVPAFLVSDVAATARWYAEHLGFDIAGHVPAHEPYVYASLQLGSAEIMLLGLAGYKKPDLASLRPSGLWDVYVRMSGVQALYESLRGLPFVTTPLAKRPYGDWEFEIRDPNGYVIVFGGDADISN